MRLSIAPVALLAATASADVWQTIAPVARDAWRTAKQAVTVAEDVWQTARTARQTDFVPGNSADKAAKALAENEAAAVKAAEEEEQKAAAGLNATDCVMTELGVGYCADGYYASSMMTSWAPGEECQELCLSEPQCEFLSLNDGTTCSAMTSSALCRGPAKAWMIPVSVSSAWTMLP